jgi:Fe-S-cluster-containing hydrogenase component 2
MINVFDDKKHCCGCSGCVYICPVGAKNLKNDEKGSLIQK